MKEHPVLIIIVVSFVATLVRSTFGFGESMVAVPLFLWILPAKIAVPLSALLSVTVALVILVQDHRKIHFHSAKWLVIYAALGIPIGLLLLVYGSEPLIVSGLGIFLIGYSVYSLRYKNKFHLQKDNKLLLFLCGFFSGIFGGAYSINGPALVIYGNLRRWPAKTFRATLQAYFLPASFLGLAGFWWKGLLDLHLFIYFGYAFAGAFPAIFLGRYFNGRLKDQSFFDYVYAGLILIGALLIYRGIR
ncbi:permease [Niabella ginsenosidivorans]|uniref:Probable membrane transporter protein n=1 Tax=Niabella ginsenosidivorans TaxID=1176587 RepID=A0A1A9I9D6_9BACT|nr:permease [Niabella ginsenosidivorans]